MPNRQKRQLWYNRVESYVLLPPTISVWDRTSTSRTAATNNSNKQQEDRLFCIKTTDNHNIIIIAPLPL